MSTESIERNVLDVINAFAEPFVALQKHMHYFPEEPELVRRRALLREPLFRATVSVKVLLDMMRCSVPRVERMLHLQGDENEEEMLRVSTEREKRGAEIIDDLDDLLALWRQDIVPILKGRLGVRNIPPTLQRGLSELAEGASTPDDVEMALRIMEKHAKKGKEKSLHRKKVRKNKK